MRIGEVAERTGLQVPAIRFYEKLGLIGNDMVRRLPNNYRDYDERVVEVLQFLKYGQSIGFSLKDLATIAGKDGLTRQSRERKAEILESKLKEIDNKITQMRSLRTMISKKIRDLRGARPG